MSRLLAVFLILLVPTMAWAITLWPPMDTPTFVAKTTDILIARCINPDVLGGGKTAGLTLVGLLAWASHSSADAMSGPEILMTLRALDETCFAALTISGTEDVILSRRTPGPPISMAWKLTMDSGRFAITTTARRIVAPSDLSPARTSNAAVQYFTEGTTPGLLARRAYYGDSKVRAERAGYASLDSEGKAGEAIPEQQLAWVNRLHVPEDPALDLELRKLTWSTGRGYSASLKEVTDLKQNGTEVICSALGSGLGGMAGRWELVIDVNAGFLVRSASFFPAGAEKPVVVIKTSGLRQCKGLNIAQTATWQDAFAAKVAEMPVQCEAFALEPDTALIEETRKAISGPFPGRTMVIDERSGTDFVRQFTAGQTYSHWLDHDQQLKQTIRHIDDTTAVQPTATKQPPQVRASTPQDPGPAVPPVEVRPRRRVAAVVLLLVTVVGGLLYLGYRLKASHINKSGRKL